MNRTMIVRCPKIATCTRDDDGCTAHCGPHQHGDGCDYGADACPPCVPCEAETEELTRREFPERRGREGHNDDSRNERNATARRRKPA
jgi:hypothetical protein